MVNSILKQSGLEGQTPAGVVLTGGGSLTINCTESCRRVMQLPAKIGIPTGLSGMIEEISTPISSVVVGLVVYGYKRKDETPSGGIKLSGMIKGIPGKQFVGRQLNL
jgi:cell division protein FtsA